MTRLRKIVVDLTPVLAGGENGGAKRVFLALIRQLATLAPDTDFLLLTQENAHRELAAFDARNVARKRVWNPPDPPDSRAIARALRHADLLFSPLCTFSLLDLDTVSTPVVGAVVDLQHRTYPQFFSPGEAAERENAFRRACRACAAMAVISDYVKRTVVADGAIAPERVSAIHIRMEQNAVPLTVADRDRRVMAFGLSPGRYLLYPANFWPHKNHEALLAAYACARRSGLPADVGLVLTGAPSDRMQALKAKAASLGLADAVTFPGYVGEADFTALLHAAGAVVFPSLYEGFGMPVVEAMAAGRPVACSDRASLPEIAGGAALLFDPGEPRQIAEALIRIMTDSALAASLIAKGRARAAEFADPARMAQDYWRLFEQAAGNGQPRSPGLMDALRRKLRSVVSVRHS